MTASPPKRDNRNASIVPIQTSPAFARAWPCGNLSKSHRAFAAENIGSSGRPLMRRMCGPQPRLRSEAQIDSVRWSCQDNTGVRASPLPRSQTTQDSRCVLRPTDTTRFAVAASSASLTARRTLPQISSASCSTQPSSGVATETGAWARAITAPLLSTTRALVELVP